MTKSAYIHIPFCNRKCNYCSFVSYDTLTLKNVYVDALRYEIKNNYKDEVLNTIYFGGGTPSVLAINDFKQILSLFKYNSDTEVTVEINPETVDKGYLQELKSLGVNRLSIGVQVFDDEILKLIGRNHTKADVYKVVRDAKNVGFDNISIDLIYGLPQQNLNSMKKSLLKAIELDVEHISLYGLKIEEGCHFYNNKPDFLPENDDQAEMYIEAVNLLEQEGFKHYEISNFSKEGFESRHNLNYWNNEHYYGFGVAASGYEGNVRYSNQINIEKYIQNPNLKISEIPVSDSEKLEEEIFLGFRRLDGIDTDFINQKYGICFDEKYKSIVDKYMSLKHLSKTKKGYKLTLEGILLSNNILSEFID